MKSLLTITFSFFALFCLGQTQQNDDAVYNIAIGYRPASLQLFTDTSSFPVSKVNNVGKMTYRNMTAGHYKIRINGPGQKEEIKDSIFVTEGQQLILNIKIDGPCLYDHPSGYIPFCPKNHKDSIIPIVYGLIGTRIDEYIKDKKDEKVRYAGCVTTQCDPMFYCKKHKIEF